MLLIYLRRAPSLDAPSTKLWLLLGLGVFPITAAMVGNVQGYQVTMKRSFCADCHVMSPEVSDSDNQKGTSLSSRHGRTELFGGDNCYACHEDYSMFGTISTKLGGMKHVWKYYTEYLHVSAEDAKKTIVLYKPFENATCIHCHSTTVEIWGSVPDHVASLAAIRSDKLSCASVGCHGYAHPNARPPTNPL